MVSGLSLLMVGSKGLKKPFRLCCPLPVGAVVVVVDIDLDRFKVRVEEESPRDRLLLVPFAGLAGGAGDDGGAFVVVFGVPFCGGAVDDSETFVDCVSRCCSIVKC